MKISIATGAREAPLLDIEHEFARATITVGENRFDVLVHGDRLIVRARDTTIVIEPHVSNEVAISAGRPQ